MQETATDSPLDEMDIRILEAMQEDASLANQELARQVHLSPAACLRRVRRLRESGVISRIVALVDAAQVGLPVLGYAFVSLENNRVSSGAQLESLVRRRREVIECVRLSGDYDFLLKIVVESMRAYSAFLDTHLLPLPAVRSVSTSFELDTLKRTTALPLAPKHRASARAGALATAAPSLHPARCDRCNPPSAAASRPRSTRARNGPSSGGRT